MDNSRLEGLRDGYINRRLTLAGYVSEAIAVLELSEINLSWLASELGVSYSGVQGAVARLRRSGQITIPTVDPRSQPKR